MGPKLTITNRRNKMKLTKQEQQRATTIAAINNLPIRKAINLVKRRLTRINTRPTIVGSARKAQPYYIL